MQGEKRAGRYRIIQENSSVLFFYVRYSNSRSGWLIADMKDCEDELKQNIDKTTERPLTDPMWERLVTWC